VAAAVTATKLLYCTGRGRHRRRDLYRLVDRGGLALYRLVYGAGPHGANWAGLAGTVDVGWSGDETPLDRPLSCPSCPRMDRQLNGGTWRRLYDGLDAEGVSDVDISRLPF
jgi:hypothetical protein